MKGFYLVTTQLLFLFVSKFSCYRVLAQNQNHRRLLLVFRKVVTKSSLMPSFSYYYFSGPILSIVMLILSHFWYIY
jgi:hypothetical protein